MMTAISRPLDRLGIRAGDGAATFQWRSSGCRLRMAQITVSSTSRAFMAWAQTHGIRHILIQPGRPMQNGYIESFNGKFRDENLNEVWLQTLHLAREAVAIWRKDYIRQAAQQLGAYTTGSLHRAATYYPIK